MTIIVFILLIGYPDTSFMATMEFGKPQIFETIESAAIFVHQNRLKQSRLFKVSFNLNFDTEFEEGSQVFKSTPHNKYNVEEVQIPNIKFEDKPSPQTR